MDFTKVEDDADEDARDEETGDDLEPPKGGCLLVGLRLLILLAVIGAVLLGLAPSILSSDSARTAILRRANESLAPRRIEIGSWSFGWWSATELRDIVYRDPAGGVECKIPAVRTDHGFWRILPLGPVSLGRVSVEKPVLTVARRTGGAAGPKHPAGASAGGSSFSLPVTGISGTLVIDAGEVTVEAPQGRGGEDPIRLTVEHAEVKVPSFKEPIGLSAKLLAGGGRLEAEGTLPSLAKMSEASGVILPDELNIKLADMDLAACQALLPPPQKVVVAGRANGSMAVKFIGSTKLSVSGDWSFDALSVDAGHGRSKPGKMKITADLWVDWPEVKIRQLAVTSPWGSAGAEGSMGFGLTAKPTLGSIKGGLDADLAAIVNDFRPVLGLTPSYRMKSGRLISGLAFRADGDGLSIEGTAAVTNFTASSGGVAIVLNPAPSLVFAVTQHRDGRWDIRRLHLRAPFAEISASGSLEALAGRGEVNLTRFRRDFGQIFSDLPPMVGTAGFNLKSKRDGGSLALAGVVTAQDLALELQPGRRTVIDKGRLDLDVTFPDAQKLRELGPGTIKLATDGVRLDASWKTATFAKTSKPALPKLNGLTASGTADTRGIRNLLGGVLAEETVRALRQYEDKLTFAVDGDCVGGTLTVRSLNLKDKYGTASAAGHAENIFDPCKRAVSIRKLEIAAPFAKVSAQGKPEDFTAHGTVNLSLLGRQVDLSAFQLPAMGGGVEFSLTSRKAKNELDLLADLTARDFTVETAPGRVCAVTKGSYNIGMTIPLNTTTSEVGPGALTAEADGLTCKASWKRIVPASGAKPSLPEIDKLALTGRTDVRTFRRLLGGVLPPKAIETLKDYDDEFAFSFAGDVKSSSVSFSPCDIKGKLGAIQSDGEATDLFGRCRIAAKGKLEVDFDRVTQLLEAAKVGDGVKLHGKTTKPFSVDAPVAGSVDSFFTDGKLDAILGLDSLTYRGVKAGESEAQATLHDGVLKAAYAPAIGEGKVNLNPEFRLERGVLVMSVPPETKLAEDIELTQQLVDEFLVKANPFFKGTTVSKGRFSVLLRSLRWITGRTTPDKGLSFAAVVSVRDLQAQPGPQLAELFSMVKLRGGTLTVKKMDIRAVVKNGRIYVSPFTVQVDDFPVTFGGSVGFDNSVDYYVEVPITDRLIGRKGDWVLNGDQKLRIPMTGTLDNPRVDYDALTRSVGRAISDTIKSSTEDFFKALRQELKQ